MNDVYLLLGGNLGDRFYYLKEAALLIGKEIAPILKTSSIYETQSWGKTDAPDYLNQVVMLETCFSARQVLQQILSIENNLGRERAEKWGVRTIDIDILFYGQDIIDEPGLHVPHPRLYNRRFTLEPLAEIAAELVHPLFNKKISQLKTELKDDLIVKKL